jgi:hypothetical protein
MLSVHNVVFTQNVYVLSLRFEKGASFTDRKVSMNLHIKHCQNKQCEYVS